MNDRFRFRFWRKNYENKLVPLYDDLMSVDGSALPYNNGEGGAWCDFEDAICEQCTGLKDKNGKLIYEGDIVKETSFDEDSCMGREIEEVSEVCFGGGDYPCSFTLKSKRYYKGFALLNYGVNRLEIEIIGNIHDNSELLEKEDE